VKARLALGLLLAASASSRPADRYHPPSPSPPRPLRLPPVERFTLSNGLPVLLVATRSVPAVEILLLIGSGALADPAGKPGVASMTASMLDEGSGGKDALTVADEVSYLGATIEAAAGWNALTVELHVPVARLSAALSLLGEIAIHPDFPKAELERLRKEALTARLQARDDPDAVASEALARAVFGGKSRYGSPVDGDGRSLAALSVSDLKAFHASHFRPGNATLIVVGQVDRSVQALLETHLGTWARGGEPPPPPPPSPQVKGRAVWLVDIPGAAQSALRLARVGPARTIPDYYPTLVMNTLLGGSFTSRLNDNLREQKGWAYGAGSDFTFRKTDGLFVAQADVQTSATAGAVSETLKELARIRTPAEAREVERARSYLALSYARNFDTSQKLAAHLGEMVLLGLSERVFADFVPEVLKVSGESVRDAASRYIDPANIAVVVVGDRKAVEGPLRASGLSPTRTLSVDDVMGPPPQLRAARGRPPSP
jgi:zinc protease